MRINKFLGLSILLSFPLHSLTLQHDPVRRAGAQADIQVAVQPDEPGKISQVWLYARTIGSGTYLRFLMSGSGMRYTGTIPGFIVQPPGVEYYIEAALVAGGVVQFPAGNAATNPVRVPLESRGVNPVLRIITPEPDENIPVARPVITASFSGHMQPLDMNSVRMYLDDEEIKTGVQIKGTFIRYRPVQPLKNGKHVVKILASDLAGNQAAPLEWSFNTGASTDPKKKTGEKWQSTGNLSSQYQYSRVYSNGSPNPIADPNGFATASFDFKAKRADEELFMGPVFLTTQQNANQQPAQSFSFGYNSNYFDTKWGNASASLSELAGGGGAILGGEVVAYTEGKKEGTGFRVQANGGRTKKPVESYESLNGAGTYGQRLLGAKLDYAFSKSFKMYGSAVDVRDIQESLVSPGSILPLENQAVATGFDFKSEDFWLDSIMGEVGYSQSKLIRNTETAEEFRDIAWKTSVGKNLKSVGVQLSASYTEYRPNFLFLYGGAGSDQRAINTSASSSLWQSQIPLSLSYGWNRDNLDGAKAATTQAHNVSLSSGLNIKNWPSLTVSDSFSYQETAGNASQNNTTINNAVNASLSYPWSLGSLQNNTSVSGSQNNSVSSNASGVNETIAQTISGTQALNNIFSWLSMSLNGSHSISSTSQSTEKSFADNGSVTFNFSIPAIKISLPLGITAGHNYNNSNPRTTDTLSLGFSLSVAYALFGTHNLSLSGGYTMFRNLLKSDANTDQVTLTFAYNTQF